MEDLKSLQASECFEKLNNRRNCSRCNNVIPQHKYKRGRTVCKGCYNNHVLSFFKNRFCQNSSLKSYSSTQTDFSNKQ